MFPSIRGAYKLYIVSKFLPNLKHPFHAGRIHFVIIEEHCPTKKFFNSPKTPKSHELKLGL